MTTADDVRSIEADALPTRFARGWHCLGLARDFTDGKPHTVRAFGQKLVVWAASDGTLNVLDAYCRHMGGDLSRGTVEGDDIACPFHAWRWGGDGRCTRVPYARRVPLRARTAAFPTVRQDGLLFVWNDPEGKPPPEEVTVPRIAGATSDEWTDWSWYSVEIKGANCREIIDNVVDMAHFFYVHYSFPTYFKNIFEGHTATQIMKGVAREDVRRPQAEGSSAPTVLGQTSVATYHGPSFMTDDLTYHYSDGDVDSVLVNCHYPITADSFMLQYGIVVQKAGHLGDTAEDVAAKMGEFIKIGFEQDVSIWQHKARIDNPLLCEEDGPVYQLRRWYEQFYVDAAEVRPEMTDRFEFEIDTTKPNAAWRAEIAENLAQRNGGTGTDATAGAGTGAAVSRPV
ncbi:aromatic ring-hydroxylating dioxygenase subunit alpha [Streptomyces tubbatahanensis]|uniref:Rieske-type oxygenase n=1 Tax=Streptomyces tubbatahanensis TaxID=2923272 RepID=A0ABY3Y1A9_9ACTN|nr:Rieske 2Fe-2S domain-containing protein [Streptomyces tubbatahanensis]UNT00550.1 aromatic ring-hydroxylating dioxygenase subunit alpha [Streptomyces tubbatahanensis]